MNMHRLLLAIIYLLVFQYLPAQPEFVTPVLPSIPNRVFNVKDFGAISDARADNTSAFQKAIDAAENAGGGKVLIPAGVYMRSHAVRK